MTNTTARQQDLRIDDLAVLLPWKKSTLEYWLRLGEFPEPHRTENDLERGRGVTRLWSRQQVLDWIDEIGGTCARCRALRQARAKLLSNIEG
jgi:hypothetical protein